MLDYGWWASNGPTAGYLMGLALQEVSNHLEIANRPPKRLDLYMIDFGRADAYEVEMAIRQGGPRTAVGVVEFRQQDRPFAIATVQTAFSGKTAGNVATGPPPVLPPEAYVELAATPSMPPVTSQFRYRPVIAADGSYMQSDWDFVWIAPATEGAGRCGVISVLDCWYPANYLRVAREIVSGRSSSLDDPLPTVLVGAHAVFAEPPSAIGPQEHVLLATRLASSKDGYFLDQCQLWSVDGRPLVSAQIIRRNEEQEWYAGS